MIRIYKEYQLYKNSNKEVIIINYDQRVIFRSFAQAERFINTYLLTQQKNN